MVSALDIVEFCDKEWELNQKNCSGFVRAVAKHCNIALEGKADQIVETITGAGWVQLADGIEAKNKADAGWFVVGGQKGSEHDPKHIDGHVAVIVSGPLKDGKYPRGYWGSEDGIGAKNTSITESWNTRSRDRVHYAAKQV